MNPGYFHSNYFPDNYWQENYWQENYWPDFGTGLATTDLHIFSMNVVEPSHVSDSGSNVLVAGDLEVQATGHFVKIDMHDNEITNVDFIDFDLTNGVAAAEGRLVHNDDEGTLNYGMKGGVVNQQIGLESLIHGKNTTSSATLDGRPARISGASGSKPEFDFSEADAPASAGSIGLFTENVADNSNGYVTTFGLVRDIDTTGTPVGEVWAAADRIFVSNTAGELTNVSPTSSERIIFIGIVIRVHATEGEIWVSPINTSYLRELSGNTFTTEVANNIIQFNGTIWENRADLTIDGKTTTNGGRVKNTTRYTTTQAIPVTDDVVFANTDGSAWTATLPAGVEGQSLEIINSGSLNNLLTITPNGAEHLLGVNSNFTLFDGEALKITFNATDGWY